MASARSTEVTAAARAVKVLPEGAFFPYLPHMPATLFRPEVLPPLERAEAQRRGNTIYQNANARARLGQYATPAPIARVMAEMLLPQESETEMRLLDPGVGAGALSLAVLERATTNCIAQVTAFDVDEHAVVLARKNLAEDEAPGQCTNVILRDYLAAPPPIRGYTHAILNPPYKKFSTSDPRQAPLRELGITTVNLYTAFVWKAITELSPGGRLVAIIPRSFANGSYYRSFRKYLRAETDLVELKLFDDRQSAFAHDDILQENLIVSLIKRDGATSARPPHRLSLVYGGDLRSAKSRSVAYEDTWWDAEGECLLRIDTTQGPLALPSSRLAHLGVSVSTGPVVDFRAEAHLRSAADEDAYPLLRPRHFSGGRCTWPLADGKRAGGIAFNEETRTQFWPAGSYVVVRRISSKEESRRVVASVLHAADLPYERICFENHLNVFHCDRAGMDAKLAEALCAYLNSETVDRFLRTISGHTQINATDLRVLPYPTREELTAPQPSAR